MKKDSKQISLLLKISGHLFFFALFVFSFLFYKERHAFDAAHYLFEIITRKGFFIAHGRIIGFVSQVLPVIGVYAGASLRSVMWLYSAGDVLWYYILFLVAAYVVKSQASIISVLLIVCLTVKFSFYCPVTELLQGMALLPLLYELLIRIKRFQFHLLPILLVVIIFSHPLLSILVGFVIAYFILQQKDIWFSKQNIFLISSFILITAAKFLLLDKYDYQKSFYPVVFDDYSNLNNITDFDFIISFFSVYFKENFLVVIFWMVTLALLLKNKKLKQMLFVFLSPVLFLILIVITHRFTAITNYSERMLLPFAGMVIIPFSLSYQEIKSTLPKRMVTIIITAVLIFRLWIIYDAAFPYAKRVAQLETLIHQAHEQNRSKCIVDERNLEYLPYAMTGWSYSLESILLSSLVSKDSSVTIALREEQYNHFEKKNLAANQIYKTQDSIINSNVLNKKYFNLKEEPYFFLNSKHDQTIDKECLLNISFIKQAFIKSNQGYCYLPIVIANTGEKIKSSLDRGYKLSLAAICLQDSAYRDQELIPFQTDVIKSLRQDLVFKNYGQKGDWKIRVLLQDEKDNDVKFFETNVIVK